MKLLVMIHPGRCGSTVLGNMLHRHSSIRWDREVFTRLKRNPIPIDDDGNVVWRDYMSFMIERCKLPNLGIDIKVRHIVKQKIFGEDVKEAMAALTAAFDFEFIFLVRQNHLERWLSTAVVQETSRFQYREGEVAPQIDLPLPEVIKDRAYNVDALPVNDWLDHVQAIDAELLQIATQRNGLVLSYEEDILHDPRIACRRVLDFAGLEHEDVQPLFVKTDWRPLSKRLSNFSDLKRMLRPDHYARYCVEDPELCELRG